MIYQTHTMIIAKSSNIYQCLSPLCICCTLGIMNPDSKVDGANMGPIWGRQDPGGPHVGPMNFAIWGYIHVSHSNQLYHIHYKSTLLEYKLGQFYSTIISTWHNPSGNNIVYSSEWVDTLWQHWTNLHNLINVSIQHYSIKQAYT